MGYPKYLPRKEVYSFRIDSDELKKLKRYALLKDTEPTKLINIAIHNILEGKVLSNDYLPNKLGFMIPLPIDKEIKHSLLNMDVLQFTDTNTLEKYLKKHTSKSEVEMVMYETDKIPNNCDIWTGETFESTEEGVAHEGIIVLITPQLANEGNINRVEDLVYFLDIQVLADDTYKVFNVNYMTALNKLKKAENKDTILHIKQVFDELTEALKEENSLEKLNDVAYIYNRGRMEEETVKLADTVTIDDETEAIQELIMECEAFQDLINEFKNNENAMKSIREFIKEERKTR